MGVLSVFGGLGTLNSGFGGIRIISTSSRITGGFSSTRLITGSVGSPLPLRTGPGAVSGGGAAGPSGMMKTVMKVLNILMWISCATAVLSTAFSIIQYFREPDKDSVRFSVTGVDEETGFIDMWIQLHDFSGLFIPGINAARGRQTLSSKQEKLLRDFAGEFVGESSVSSGGWNEATQQYELSKDLDRLTITNYDTNLADASQGNRVKVSQQTIEIPAAQFMAEFRAVLVRAQNYRDLKTGAENLIAKYAEAESFNEDDDTCVDCGHFNLEIYPDEIYCVDARYRVKVMSAAKARLAALAAKTDEYHNTDPFDSTVQQKLINDGYLPAFLSQKTRQTAQNPAGVPGLPNMGTANGSKFAAAVCQIEWDWVGGSSQDTIEFPYSIYENESRTQTAITFTKSVEGDPDTVLEFDFIGLHNDCADPYYWEGGALPDVGYDSADTDRNQKSATDWSDNTAILSEKASLNLTEWGIPSGAAAGEITDGSLVREELVGGEDYDHWGTSAGQTSSRAIEPYVFEGKTVYVAYAHLKQGFGGQTENLGNILARAWSATPCGIRNVGGYQMSRSDWGVNNAGRNPSAPGWKKCKTEEAARNAIRNHIDAIQQAGGSVIGQGEISPIPGTGTFVNQAGNPKGNGNTFFAWAVVDEPLYTCDSCKPQDSDGCNGPGVVQCIGSSSESFLIGIPYVLAIQKEILRTATGGTPEWEKVEVEESELGGLGKYWSVSNTFNVPCITKTTPKMPLIQIGNPRRLINATPINEEDE